MEEEAVASSAEGRIGAKEGGESEEASAAQIGRVQKWRKEDSTEQGASKIERTFCQSSCSTKSASEGTRQKDLKSARRTWMTRVGAYIVIPPVCFSLSISLVSYCRFEPYQERETFYIERVPIIR